MTMLNPQLIIGDAREALATLPSGSVRCCVTSPPYWGLRDYGVAGQMGLETTPEEYVAGMVAVFREVRRVLADDGTCFVNIGDSYSGSGKGGNPEGSAWSGFVGGPGREKSAKAAPPVIPPGLKPKDLVGIPWRLAFALQSDGAADMNAVRVLDRVRSELIDEYKGETIPDRVLATLERMDEEYRQAKGASWWLRQDIIWHKPNPMPESVLDRCTKAHEYIFLLTKSGKTILWRARDTMEWSRNPDLSETVEELGETKRRWIGFSYYWDAEAVKEDAVSGGEARGGGVKISSTRDFLPAGSSKQNLDKCGGFSTRNPRSVWTIATRACSEAHFATFPPELPERCIRAGTAPGDTVLDPFTGAGTTGMVAVGLGRDFVGIELNPKYAAIAARRIDDVNPMFVPPIAVRTLSESPTPPPMVGCGTLS